MPGSASARIRRLPGALVDQIAAGEVVERPASVVKELVENAVDAGAGRLRVEVRGGGAALVAVTDDGQGMSAADARLALERHATSKLTEIADLSGIASFGFRGEALPAIASVSRMRLRSRPHDAEQGVELRVDQGRLVEEREIGAPAGTRIEVADLFAGVPARRKFLKKPTTEWGHVSDWLTRAALALPLVHFDVLRDDKAAQSWPAVEDRLDRIAAVLSERDAAALVRAERDASDLRIEAFVSRPEAHRATGSGIHLFVNGRPVRDRVLRHALLQVTRDVLPRGRFPTALVFLEVEGDGVDVNVHPAKWEVRFADPRAVHGLLTATVRDALASRSWLGSGTADARTAASPDASQQGAGTTSETDWIFASSPEAPPDRVADAASGSDLGTGAGVDVGGDAPVGIAARPFRFAELRLLGQLLATYLLVEHKEGLLLVDQHAAHERVLYERLRAAWLEGGVQRQALLVPASVELEAPAAEALLARADFARELGFEVDDFGGGTVALRAVPALLAERDPVGLLRGLADELRESGDIGAPVEAGTRILDAADHRFASMACHSARRAGEVLSAEEQRALLRAVDEIPWAPTCPHGRPVAVPIRLGEIERRFSRS